MVRQKNRWIIVQLYFDDQLLITSAAKPDEGSTGSSQSGRKKRRRIDGLATSNVGAAPVPIEPKDIHRVIRTAMEALYGTVGAGVAHTIRVSLYDETSRIAIIKMPRESCGMVRSAATFLTSINDANVVMSTIGVHGSARTVKIAALAELRKIFNEDHKVTFRDKKGGNNTLTKEEEKAFFKLEARMNKVRDID